MGNDEYARIRDMLWKWGWCYKRITELLNEIRQINEWEGMLYDIGHSPRIDGMPRSTVMGDPVMREVERIDEARKGFKADRDACETELLEVQRYKREFGALVAGLPRLERDILRMRYVQGHTFAWIAGEIRMAERTIYKREADAIGRLSMHIRQETPQ